MESTLTIDQQKAIKNLHVFLNSDAKFFLLTGSAGTGKTSIIVNFLSSLSDVRIAFSATTNKAVSVLEKMLNQKLEQEHRQDLRKNITFLTIHKLLKIKRRIDLEGNEIFVTSIDDDNPIHLLNSKSIYGYDIIVIDEVSMMPEPLMEKLLKIKSKLPGKVIFVGDSAQLPPVNEDSSYVFNLDMPTCRLKNVVRNSGNMTILSDQVRQLVLKNGNVSLRKLANDKIQLYRDKKQWIDHYISQVSTLFKQIQKGEIDVEDSNLPIVLTYRNSICNDINNRVRNILFKFPKDKYVSGDIIVFNSFYHLPSNKNKYYTSQQALVKLAVVDQYHLKNLKRDDIINVRKSIKNLTVSTKEILKPVIGDTEACGICYHAKDVKKTVCGHFFCTECFDRWFQISETCPMCRINFQEEDLVFQGDTRLTNLINNLRTITEDKSYKVWILTTHKGDNILCIHQDSLEEHQEDLDDIRQYLLRIKKHIDKKYKANINFMNTILTRLWDFYYFQFVDQFADIVYGYAITTHKSQGSTYENVYIEMNDIIHSNPNDKNSHQCLYTAVTRASQKLHIFY